MNIGDKIKACRISKNYTQKELAQKCGFATGTIQQYELGKRTPRLEQLLKIADALELNNLALLDSSLYSIQEMRTKNTNEENADDLPAIIVFNAANKLERLNEDGIVKAFDYMDDLAEIPKYMKSYEKGNINPDKKKE